MDAKVFCLNDWVQTEIVPGDNIMLQEGKQERVYRRTVSGGYSGAS